MLYRFRLESNQNLGSLTIPSDENPLGWDGIEIKLKRHEKYHGIFPDISTKLEFFGSAYNFILACYETHMINANVSIIIDVREENVSSYINVFNGNLDFTDISFTDRFVSCSIRTASCVDLFLDRTDVSMNLYDEPCFDELTFDKNAKRTRYVFAPYLVAFPEKTILGAVSWKLDTANTQVINKFSLDGGLGCSLVISSDPSVPAYEAYCGNTDPSENNTNSLSQFQNSNGDYIYYLINGVQLISLVDDLNFINEGFAPQHFQEQYQRDCGNTAVITETPWVGEDEWNGELQDCSCCGTYCDDYVLEIDVVANMSMCVEIIEGVVEWFTWIHELVLQWGDNEYILQANPLVADTNGCAGWDDTEQCNDSVNDCIGTPGCLFYNGTITIAGCDVKAGDKFRIITRTAVGFKAGGALAGNSNLSVLCTTDWVKCDGRMVTKNCIPDAARVGETNVYSYAIHESFSRLVEYYTNNCLRVKSDYFSRPNSFEGADDLTFQCDIGEECGGGGSGSVTPECPLPCCDAEYTYNVEYFQTVCSSTHVPPAAPPTPCFDSISAVRHSNITFVGEGCEIVQNKEGCVVLPCAGEYLIEGEIIVDATTAIISFSNARFDGITLSDAFMSAEVVFYINGVNTSIFNQSKDTSTLSVGCNTGNLNYTTDYVVYPISETVTITETDIINSRNQICLSVSSIASVVTVISCDDNPADLSVLNDLYVSGNINISNTNCEYPPPTPECEIECQTFDPKPYQSCDENGGCGAWTILTSGINLRQFGTAMFTSFDELFSSMNAIHNIGVGFAGDDIENLRIENVEYFYQKKNVIFRIDDLDLKNSNFKRKVYSKNYFSKIESGYRTWLQDKVNTIDAFHSTREYKLKNINTRNTLNIQSDYIADGYAIEWQRRQRWTANSELDDEKFVVCVGRSTDINNLNCYSDPDSMYRVEIGVEMPFTSNTNPPFYAPDGFIDPDTIYNWRISPLANTVRHLSHVKSSMYKSGSNEIDFSKGEANFTCGGREVCTNLPCDVGYDYDNSTDFLWCENEDIDIEKFNLPRTEQITVNETIEFEYPITISQFLALKNNLYGIVIVNDISYFILEIDFKNNENSKFKLLRAY